MPNQQPSELHLKHLKLQDKNMEKKTVCMSAKRTRLNRSYIVTSLQKLNNGSQTTHPCTAFNHCVTIASYIKAMHANSLRPKLHMCSASLAPVGQVVVVTSMTAVGSGRLMTKT